MAFCYPPTTVISSSSSAFFQPISPPKLLHQSSSSSFNKIHHVEASASSFSSSRQKHHSKALLKHLPHLISTTKNLYLVNKYASSSRPSPLYAASASSSSSPSSSSSSSPSSASASLGKREQNVYLPSQSQSQSQSFQNVNTNVATAVLTNINTKAPPQDENIESTWQKKGNGSPLIRTIEVWIFFFKFLFAELKIRKLTDKNEIIQRRQKLAKDLRVGLVTLGPTFIKLGQLLSTRVDILPKQYIDELVKLQDDVPRFSTEVAIQIIEEEFQRPLNDIFKTFNKTPIAAASLGQVHVAELHNGTKVAVKVQRKGLRALFDVDLKNLKWLAILLDKFDPKTDGARRDWVVIYDESAKLLYKEIDYELEAENADRFKKNFNTCPWVKVPDIIWEFTSTRVLTMEYVPGVKVNDVKGLREINVDPYTIGQRSGQSYLEQLLRHGFFHCDPHPGNIAVDNTVEGGRLIYYDFGMMSELKPQVKEGLIDLIFGIYEGSARDICDAMEKMGVLGRNVDRVSVEKVGRYFLDSFRSNMKNNIDTKLRTKEEKEAEMAARLGAIGEDLISVGDDVPFRFPATFTFVFRAFTTLEGIGKVLDKNYNLPLIARPYITQLVDSRDGSIAISLLKSAQKKAGLRPQDIEDTISQPKKTAYVYSTMKRMEEGELKLRVRVLESERAFKRMSLQQETMGVAMVTSMFMNVAIILATTGAKFATLSSLSWFWSMVFGLRAIIGLLKIKAYDKKMKKYVGSSD